MKFSTKIKQLEKRKIISKKPNPLLPFILVIISLGFGFYFDKPYENFFFGLAIFTFIFAILHLIVWKICK